jgi:redox-sensitive bicupin YhaK (pirin superfamily)
MTDFGNPHAIAPAPTVAPPTSAAVPIVVPAHLKDLGGFTVGRVLPHAARRNVSYFVFLDHMGPATLSADRPMSVRPHPHIGLSTVTYLYDGTILHQDSMGVVQTVSGGELNWMTAGHGVRHSERSPQGWAEPMPLHGLQFWVAAPVAEEELPPAFQHFSADELPRADLNGVTLTIVAGEVYGLSAPTRTQAPLHLVDAIVEDGATFDTLPAADAATPQLTERAIYVAAGSLRVAGQLYTSGQLLVLAKDAPALSVTAVGPTRIALFGGVPIDAPRHMFWNFVSSRPERLEQAKADWLAQNPAAFPLIPTDSAEFIPLP